MDTANIPNLLEYALRKTRESAEKRELPTVAREAEVDYSWLGKFALGRIPGAAYDKVHKVATYYFERDRREALERGLPPPEWPFHVVASVGAPSIAAP